MRNLGEEEKLSQSLVNRHSVLIDQCVQKFSWPLIVKGWAFGVSVPCLIRGKLRVYS